MNRLQLFEIHDFAWCPSFIRDSMTELMRWSIDCLRIYDPIIPKLHFLMHKTGSNHLIDLCSGGAGPWRRLATSLEKVVGAPVKVTLTDKYPNIPSLTRAKNASNGHLDFVAESVDATHVPPSLTGVRTLFSSFHHFPPELARAILHDAAEQGAAIGVFEFTERSLFACLSMLFTPLVSLMVVPFLRPWSVGRVLSCLPVPFVPLIATWDGMVSNIRTYSPRELQQLVEEIKVPGYRWESGRISGAPGRLAVTYLIGHRDS